ncbi:MAG: 30S ribosomal protein S2 [Patescibacteria group bacterium]
MPDTELTPAQAPAPSTVSSELATEMVKAGIVIGHTKSKTHPRMRPFIAGTRNEVELLSPESTLESLGEATAFLKTVAVRNGIVLLVGTGLPARGVVLEFANEFKFPYVTTRWLGGTLTNFKVISTRLRQFEELKEKKEKGELQKYTKREQLEFDKDISKMAKSFTGLRRLAKLPDALIVVDVREHLTAVREARALSIPVVAIMDTDDDPDLATYPVFASDHAKSSIEWVFGKFRDALREALAAAVAAAPVAPKA